MTNKTINTYPYSEFDSNGNLIYLVQLYNWVKNNEGVFTFTIEPIKVWFKREYNNNGELIHHEDSSGNYWSKKLTPDIEYPYNQQDYLKGLSHETN